jgi:hypothetical protein
MTQLSTVLAQQAEALIQMLRHDEAAACARETQQASQRARALLRTAYRDARRLVREAVEEERNRRDNALGQARAAVATRRRQHAQRDASQVVRAAWGCLPRILQAIWDDPQQRHGWCRTAVSGAARVLRPDKWEISCPATLAAAELASLCDQARAAGVREVVAHADSALHAGIAIRSAGAVFDATAAGLLASREGIEAELHAAWIAESSA